MEAFADSTLADRRVGEFDVPSLYYLFHTKEQLLPEEIQAGILAVLRDKHGVAGLYVKNALDPRELVFPAFFQLWCRKRLFASDAPLDFLLQHYKIYSVEKALQRAARHRRFDFVDAVLTRKRLLCSLAHIEAVCYGVFSSPYTDSGTEDYTGAWHQEKVQPYTQKLLARVEYREAERDDIRKRLDEISNEAAQKAGFDNDESYIEDYVFAERWDMARKMAPDMEDPIRMSNIALSKPKLYFHPERIPEDLRQYFVFDRIKDLKRTEHRQRWVIDSKRYIQLVRVMGRVPGGIMCGNDRYLDELEDPEKIRLLPSNYEKQAWLQIKRYCLGLEAEKPRVENSHISSYERLLWLCKGGYLQKGAPYCERLYYAINLAFNLYGHGYYPDLLRSICKHHFEDVKTQASKAELLTLTGGDTLMTEFVQSLPF